MSIRDILRHLADILGFVAMRKNSRKTSPDVSNLSIETWGKYGIFSASSHDYNIQHARIALASLVDLPILVPVYRVVWVESQWIVSWTDAPRSYQLMH